MLRGFLTWRQLSILSLLSLQSVKKHLRMICFGSLVWMCASICRCQEVEEETPLRAYEMPDRIGLNEAVSGVWIIASIAALGIFIFFILFVRYYTPSSFSQISHPTVVRRKSGFKPTPRPREEKFERFEIDETDLDDENI